MIQDHVRKIEQVLHRLWLSHSEIQVFFAGLERGAATIKQLAEDTRMNRITVHEIVRRLIKKWVFLETYSKKKRLVYPNQMEALPRLVEQKKYDVQQLEQDALKAASLLKSLQSQSAWFPKSRFYKGKEGIQIVLNEIKQDRQDAALMSDGQHFYDLIDNDFLEKSVDIRQRYKIRLRMIFPAGFEYFTYTQGTYQQQLEIKALPEHPSLKWGMISRWDKIARHCYEGSFITTTILENPQISGIMQFLFEHLREQSREY